MAAIELRGNFANQEASWNTLTGEEQARLLVGGAPCSADHGRERRGVLQASDLEAQREVQALLDVPRIQESSGVVERLQQRRKERHDQLLSELDKELSVIHEKLQPVVKRAVEELRQKQDEIHQGMEAELTKVREEQSSLTLSDVEGVWQGVESQLTLRLRLIDELSEQLALVERQRAEQVCACLHTYSELLGGVAYCSAGELAGMLQEKAHSLNMSSLANRQSAAQLCSHLAAAERQVMVELRASWEGELVRWRESVLSDTLSRFKVHIGVSDHEGVRGERGRDVEKGMREAERVKRELITELSGLQLRKQELLTQLSSLAPPTVSVEMLHRLRKSSHDLHQQMESCLRRQLLGLGQAVEQVSRACEAEMEASKDTLVQSGACDSSSVYQVLTLDYLPLTEKLVKDIRTELHSIERSVESHLTQQQSWFQSVLQYGIGASQLWKHHSSALVEVKRSRGEAMERLRTEHDTKNQNREANLDLVLDHMRQAPNEEMLDQCLEEATSQLKTIAEGYEAFHAALLAELGAWPAVAERCVREYDSALCQYLGVGREPPATSSKKDRAKAVQSSNKTKATGKKSKKTTPTSPSFMPRPPSVATIVEEVVVKNGVLKYYITSEAEAGQEERGSVFLTQDEESEGVHHKIATQALPLNRDTVQQARTSLRAMYLSHLETWREEVCGEEERERREREEESHTELDLRQHLHKPRQARITRDIHGVRAAELVAHRDRVSRHARAVVAAIADIKTSAQAAPDAMKTQEEEYAREMESLTASVAEAVSTVGLQQVESRARQLLEKWLQSVERISADCQVTSEEAITDLSTANTAFRHSLKLFSEAGNYCPEEVELFSHKLDRLAAKMATAQSHVVSEVGVACAEHTRSVRETFTLFQNTYQVHWTDVCYMERVERSLTSLQVSIHSVVADSNRQARKLHDDITELRDMMESGDPAPILAGLPAVVTLCTQRTAYLHCRATLRQGGRVGGERKREREGEGRQQGQPISAVNISCSIREHTRASTDDHQPAASHHRPAAQLIADKEAGRKTGTQSHRKTVAVVERKNVNFGVGGGGEGASCFLPQIRALLTSCYADLYSTTEEFYHVKGSRPVTRPQSIAGSCEEALDRLIDTCQTYRRQCEEYRNNAITEFRGQLDMLLSLVVDVTQLVMETAKSHHLLRWKMEREHMEDTHCRTIQDLAMEKSSHEHGLHPGLGHPAATRQLEEMREAEQQRHSHLLDHLQHHSASMQSAVQGIGRELAKELVADTERLLTLYDTLPTTNEIIPGSVKKTQLPVDQLLREKRRPTDKVKDGEEGVAQASSQGGHWPGLNAALLDKLLLGSVEKGLLSGAVSSKKSSVAHSSVISARDTALQEFVLCVEKDVLESEERGREEREKEGHWWKHWNNSLLSLAQLYST